MGPSDYSLDKALPAGSDTYQLEISPSGHLVLPICEYDRSETDREYSLTLATGLDGSGGGNTEASSSNGAFPSAGIPPAPTYPPILPSTVRRSVVLPPPPPPPVPDESQVDISL